MNIKHLSTKHFFGVKSSTHCARQQQFPRVVHCQPQVKQIEQTLGSGARCSISCNCMDKAPSLLDASDQYEIIDGGLLAAKGFSCSGIYGGLRQGKKKDLALLKADVPAVSAAVFTQNVMCAAPVQVCRKRIESSSTASAVIVNAGQANAGTGKGGLQDAIESSKCVAELLGVDEDQILVMSTGVIGVRFDVDKMKAAIPSMIDALGVEQQNATDAAIAITTTDLVYKEAAVKITIGGKEVHIGGAAKGSGMICPNMATLLGMVTCDADVDSKTWRQILKIAANNSFNQITVDGDVSTNDTIIGLASGASGCGKVVSIDSSDGMALLTGVTAVLQALAKSVAFDGEGATCLIEITVNGANTDADARVIAKSVAGSSLFKSAVFGHDPNWGRIAAAAGYSGVVFNQDDLSVKLGDIQLMSGGEPEQFDKATASKYLKDTCNRHGTVYVTVGVGNGEGSGKAWGCDLSYDYVKINAEYTT